MPLARPGPQWSNAVGSRRRGMIKGGTIGGRVSLTFAEGVAEVRLDRAEKLNSRPNN